MKLFTIVGLTLMPSLWHQVDGEKVLHALVSSLPDKEHIDMTNMNCKDGTVYTENENFGCWLLKFEGFFHTPSVTADLSVPMPSMSDRLYNHTGMYNMVRQGCFSLTSMNGDVEHSKYSFSSLEGYKSHVTNAANIAATGKGSFMTSSLSATYTSRQTTAKKVNSKFSFAKAHVRSELKMGKVTNNCISMGIHQFLNDHSSALWNRLLKSPNDEEAIRYFNNHFQTLQPDSWLLGGLHYGEVKVEISDESTLDLTAIEKGVEAAANVKLNQAGGKVTGTMTSIIENAVASTDMTTILEATNTTIAPMHSAVKQLVENDALTPEEYSRLKAQALEEFASGYDTFAPYQVVGYTSTLDMMLTAANRLKTPGLGGQLAKALHEENVKCQKVTVQAYRLIRNSTGKDGKVYTYALNCFSDFSSQTTANLCRFERAVSTSMLLERDGTGLNSYALHFVSHPEYTPGSPQGDLTVCETPVSRKLCAVGRRANGTKQDLPDERIRSFRYNDTCKAFTLVAQNPSGQYTPTSFPLPARYIVPRVPGAGYHFFLNSDAQLMGTNVPFNFTEVLDQHTYFQAVPGVRATIDGLKTEICHP